MSKPQYGKAKSNFKISCSLIIDLDEQGENVHSLVTPHKIPFLLPLTLLFHYILLKSPRKVNFLKNSVPHLPTALIHVPLFLFLFPVLLHWPKTKRIQATQLWNMWRSWKRQVQSRNLFLGQVDTWKHLRTSGFCPYSQKVCPANLVNLSYCNFIT